MDPINDDKVVEMLSRAGRAMTPRPARLASALKESVPGGNRPHLSIISVYMNYTKVGIALVAVLVVVGGGYYWSMSGGTGTVALKSVATETPIEQTAGTAPTTLSTVAPTPTAATDSFDDFATAMNADALAQQVAVASADQSAVAAASSANTVTSSSEPYDPSSI